MLHRHIYTYKHVHTYSLNISGTISLSIGRQRAIAEKGKKETSKGKQVGSNHYLHLCCSRSRGLLHHLLSSPGVSRQNHPSCMENASLSLPGDSKHGILQPTQLNCSSSVSMERDTLLSTVCTSSLRAKKILRTSQPGACIPDI